VTSDVQINQRNGHTTAVIKIVEGATYSVRDVTFEGNELIENRGLLANIKSQPKAMYSPEALHNDVDALERLYKTDGRGRGHAIVEGMPSFALDQQSVDIRFTVKEGPVVYVRRISTRGNYKTRQKVILRESDIHPGDVYDTFQIDEFKRRLVNLNLFKNDEEERIEISETDVPPQPGDERQWVDLTVSVQEMETGRAGVGAGVGSDSGVYGTIFLRQPNFDYTDWPNFERDGWAAFFPGNMFTGAGQSLLLEAAPGQTRSRYVAMFEEPYLWDKPYRFRPQLRMLETEYSLYDESRLGASVYLGKRLTRTVEAGVSYRLESVDVGSIKKDSPTDVYDSEGSNIVSALKFSIGEDKLDFRSMPSSGYERFASLEFIGGPLMGDVSALKGEIGGRKYYTVKTDERSRKHVVALRGRAGTIWGYGGDDVPIFERFYAGGGGTYGLRGFRHDGVGPRGQRTYIDPDNPALGTKPTTRDEPIGGRFLALSGVEYQFPLVGNSLRGVTFVDAGTVSSDFGFSGLSDVRLSVGFGFRIFIPSPMFQGVPITLDFGIPLLKRGSDETELINFSLGIAF
jgi:outer membrane protein insertion porin family